MAKKINVRKILSLHHQNLSINQIAKGYHFSKHSVIDVIHRANELKFDDSTLGSLNDEELYQLFFPEKFAGSQLYFKPDYERVHQELKEHGVTLKLLWQEYCDTVSSNLFPISYPSFCAGYNDYYVSQNLTSRVIHKPGVRSEVDWIYKDSHDQSTPHFVLRSICIVSLFVST